MLKIDDLVQKRPQSVLLPVVAWLAHRSFPEARNQTPENHDVPGFVNLKSQEYRVCHQDFLQSRLLPQRQKAS